MPRLWILCLIAASLVASSLPTHSSTVKAFICPPNETIDPCFCRLNSYTLTYEVICQGPLVSQSKLDDLFHKLREANGLTPDDILEFGSLDLLGPTALTTLNLSFAVNTKLSQLSIRYADRLTSISQWIEGQPERSIEVNLLNIYSTGLTDVGFGNALQFFNKNLTSLYLPHNQFKGEKHPLDDGSGDVEFIQGLSSFLNLEILSLYGNPIQKLSGGQFKRMPKLASIDLELGRFYQGSFGENAFALQTTSSAVILYLGRTEITEGHFSNINITGLTSSSNAFYLHLNNNPISTLERSIFEPFLLAHPQNTLNLEGDPLICDGRLSWLKNKAAEFRSRVLKANCNNGNGESIWESELIP